MVVGRMSLRRWGELQPKPVKSAASRGGSGGGDCNGGGAIGRDASRRRMIRSGGVRAGCSGSGGSGGSGGDQPLAGSDAHRVAADRRQDAFAKGVVGEEHALGTDVEAAADPSGGGRQGREDPRCDRAQRIPPVARRDAHLGSVLLGGRDGGGRGATGSRCRRLLAQRPGAAQGRHGERSRGHGIDVEGDRLVDVPVAAAHPLVLHDRSCLAWIHRTKSDQWFGGVAPDVFLASEAGTSIIASSSTKTCHHRQKKSATPFSVRLLEN